jgi:hypothetical protein
MNENASSTDEYLANLPAWQQANLNLFRKLVSAANPNITNEIKWGVPVFLLDGKIALAMSAFKEHTKYNFIANGASLADQDHLFNNGLESKKSRGIDLREGETISESALSDLIKQSLEKLN